MLVVDALLAWAGGSARALLLPTHIMILGDRSIFPKFAKVRLDELSNRSDSSWYQKYLESSVTVFRGIPSKGL